MCIAKAKEIAKHYLSSRKNTIDYNGQLFGLVGGRLELSQRTLELLPSGSSLELKEAALLMDVVEVAGVGFNNLKEAGISDKTLKIIHDLRLARKDDVAEVSEEALCLTSTRVSALKDMWNQSLT